MAESTEISLWQRAWYSKANPLFGISSWLVGTILSSMSIIMGIANSTAITVTYLYDHIANWVDRLVQVHSDLANFLNTFKSTVDESASQVGQVVEGVQQSASGQAQFGSQIFDMFKYSINLDALVDGFNFLWTVSFFWIFLVFIVLLVATMLLFYGSTIYITRRVLCWLSLGISNP